MEIVLRRNIRVSRANVVGKVAYPKKRVAEHAVVVWAAERLREGLPPRAELLCDASAAGPLLGMPPVVGARLAWVCAELGLIQIDQRDRARIVGLTPEGERVAASAEPRVFVPELGTWALFWADDPLLTQPLLRVEPWKEPSAHDDDQKRRKARRAQGGGGDETRRPIGKTPKALADLCNDEGPPLDLPAANDGIPVRLMALEDKAEIVASQEELTVGLSLSPGATAGITRLQGHVGGAALNRKLPGPSGWGHAEVWWALLRTNGADAWWNPHTGRLRCSWKTLPDEARSSFQLRMSFKAPLLQGLGRFEGAVVSHVPIEPATQDDAQRWFMWLLERGAQRAQWPDLFTHSAEELRARFSGFDVRAPGQADFARSIRGEARPGPAYWRLQAPLDLDGGTSR